MWRLIDRRDGFALTPPLLPCRPHQTKSKQEEDKASLTKDLVMDEEAISKLPMTFVAR